MLHNQAMRRMPEPLLSADFVTDDGRLYAFKGVSMLKSVVQEETAVCGIASVANILGKTYSEMKAAANAKTRNKTVNRTPKAYRF